MEIKLKGWNNIVKRMSPPITLEELHKTENVQFQNITWLLWTGLKDKNGVDIYDGDILSHYNGAEDDIILKYEPESAGFNICYGILECVIFSSDIKVIGNIYEDKHLLNLKKVDHDN